VGVHVLPPVPTPRSLVVISSPMTSCWRRSQVSSGKSIGSGWQRRRRLARHATQTTVGDQQSLPARRRRRRSWLAERHHCSTNDVPSQRRSRSTSSFITHLLPTTAAACFCR